MTRLDPNAPDIVASHATAQALWEELWPDPEAGKHLVVMGKATGAICCISDCYEETSALAMCQTHYKRHARVVANEAAKINAHHHPKAAA